MEILMRTSCRVEENRFWSSFSREGIHSWSLLPLQTRTPCLTSFLFLSHRNVCIQVFWDHITVTTTLSFVSCPRANHEVVWWVLKQLQIMFVTEFTDCRAWKRFFIEKRVFPTLSVRRPFLIAMLLIISPNHCWTSCRAENICYHAPLIWNVLQHLLNQHHFFYSHVLND